MAEITAIVVEDFINRQIAEWPTAKDNYAALEKVRVKSFELGRSKVKVQFNPARIVSSAAKVDAKSLQERKCFLCEANRPAVQEGLAWCDYTILLNPFPIFPRHLTIPCNAHVAQRIKGRLSDMMQLAQLLDGFTLFYNGPKCGASAPDHCHFQAGNKGFMPIEHDYSKADKSFVAAEEGATMSLLSGLAECCFLIEATSVESGEKLFNKLYDALPIPDGEAEPMLNILCFFENDAWRVLVFPRKKHRPSCYFAEGEENILISPASVDMGGVFITPLEKDFNKITAEDIEKILNEVCLSEEDALVLVNKMVD